MTKTTDGFQIAEEDLRLRGPGDFFGARQHGLPGLKVADLGCDTQLLQEARQAADGYLKQGRAWNHGRAGDGALHTAGGCPELKLPGRSRGVFAVLCDLLPRSLVITAEGGEASDRSGTAL